MARDSIHKKLSRVRPPRVQVSYEVHVGDAIEMKELPFVVGVLGDFTGNPDPEKPLPRLRERRFVEVTPDNFDNVLAKMKPRVAFTVDNKLTDDVTKKLPINLTFESMDDFSPERVASKVEPLNELLKLRKGLSDLSGTLQTNNKLGELLMEAVSDTEKRTKLKDELGIKGKGTGA